jgi:hypothetical protein
MSLELVVGLIGSQLVRAVASEVATTLACQAIQHAVGTMARPTATTQPVTAPAQISAPATVPDQIPDQPAREVAPPELRALPLVEVVSSVPGRARLRVQGIRDDETRAAEIAATVRALDGVAAAEANALTGTLLIRYTASQIDLATIVAALEPPTPTRPLRASERVPYLRLVVG